MPVNRRSPHALYIDQLETHASAANKLVAQVRLYVNEKNVPKHLLLTRLRAAIKNYYAMTRPRPFAEVVEVLANQGPTPEQRVIDASYAAYKKRVAGRNLSVLPPVSFSQWLNMQREYRVVIKYKVHDEIVTEVFVGKAADKNGAHHLRQHFINVMRGAGYVNEIKQALQRGVPTRMTFGYEAAKAARDLNLRVQTAAANADRNRAVERYKDETAGL